jgi:tRNA(Ile2) C34 agmatinyltransferase TiaS
MPARAFSHGTDHAAQYPRRPYDNQYNRYCPKCDGYHLHTKGRKYWTCLTCDTRTEREPATLPPAAEEGKQNGK